MWLFNIKIEIIVSVYFCYFFLFQRCYFVLKVKTTCSLFSSNFYTSKWKYKHTRNSNTVESNEISPSHTFLLSPIFVNIIIVDKNLFLKLCTQRYIRRQRARSAHSHWTKLTSTRRKLRTQVEEKCHKFRWNRKISR